MNADHKKMLKRILVMLDVLKTALGGGGALPANAATESTLVAVNNSIAALKDGEFRIFSDPNDNDRHVALSVDMTDPSSPVYQYNYLDNNAVYGGNVNDLDTVGNTTQANIEIILNDIVNKFNIKQKGRLWDLSTSIGDAWVGFPLSFTEITIIFDSPYMTAFTETVQLGQNRTIESITEFIDVLNSQTDTLIFEEVDAGQIVIHSGTMSAGDVNYIEMSDDLNGDYEYQGVDIVIQLNDNVSLLGLMARSLEKIENSLTSISLSNWEYTKGRIKTYEYYTGVTGANPSGNNNLFRVYFKINSRVFMTQEYHYDINDLLVEIGTF